MLHFLKVFQKCWQDFFYDFVTDLSELKNINVIFIVVDRLLKKWHYILCCTEDKQTSLKKTVWLFIHKMFHYHDLSQSIVSDQRPQFINRMWKSLLKQLNINPLISISHHPETDGQMKCFNQKVKTEFCFYINHLQNN